MNREEKWDAVTAGKKRRRRSNTKMIMLLIAFLILLVGVMYSAVLLYTNLKENREMRETLSLSLKQQEEEAAQRENIVTYSQEELDQKIAEAVAAAQDEEALKVLDGIRESLSEGTTTIETLRPYYPDDLVVVSGGKFHFVPIDRTLKQSELTPENLNVLETGEFQYLTDGQVTSHKGIDVSSHQGDIDWEKVAADGVEFAIIRVGFRGYGTGKLVEDEKFEDNIRGAKAAGIKVGVYFFSQAINEEEVQEEAELVLEKIEPYELDCPVVYDVEKVADSSGRMNGISVEERTNLTLLFCQTVEKAGYTPMIYHNTEMAALMIDLAALEDYDKWYASYSDQMFYPYEYKIWQYSEKGSVSGIKTDVDLNISFAPVWEE